MSNPSDGPRVWVPMPNDNRTPAPLPAGKFVPVADTHEWRQRERIADLEAENKRLREALDKFPKTADGEPATPGMRIFCPHGHEAHNHHNRAYCTTGCCWDDGCQSDDGSGTAYRYEQCYSTPEAAAKAR